MIRSEPAVELADTESWRDHARARAVRIRIAVDTDADRATLAMVLVVLGVGAAPVVLGEARTSEGDAEVQLGVASGV